MTLSLRIFSFLLLNLFFVFGYAQTGPAGIGNSTNNVLWVKAGDIVGLNDGDDITTWLDTSGNGNDLSQPNTSFKPVYRTNIVNGQPVVRFNKTNGRLRKNPFNSFPSTQITSIVVNINDGETSDAILSYASSTHNNDYLLFSSSNVNIYQVSNRNTTVDFNNNVWNILNVSWNSSGGIIEAWKNGSIEHYSTGFRSGGAITANGSLALAGEQDVIDGSYAANQAHFGDFPEVIMYNYVLDTSDQIIVSNYLSAKYDIPLASNDLYDEDDVGSGDFDFEVAGIGRESSTAFNDDAKGSSILRINMPSDLNNNEYMIWGHNNLESRASNTIDVPGTVEARYARVWRVSEVNTSGTAVDVGSVNVVWDLSTSWPVLASDLRLLVDTDNDGMFSDEVPISGATDIGGDAYQFTAVTALANNLRFTLATINSSSTTLPIELIDFNVREIDGTIVLDWETATETNNDFFTIEKSNNGTDWNFFSQTKGTGNTNHHVNYEIFDKNPFLGENYYRLTQTDFDGTVSKAIIKSVIVLIENFSLFPNPSNNVVLIKGESKTTLNVKMYTALGQEVVLDEHILWRNKYEINLDVTKLPSGVYFIKTLSDTKKLIVKNR